MDFKFDWGDEVCVVESAPGGLQAGEKGSVCGMRHVGDTNLYVVEFSEGINRDRRGLLRVNRPISYLFRGR